MNTGSFWSSNGSFHQKAIPLGVGVKGADYFDPHLIIKEPDFDPCHFRIKFSDEVHGWGNVNYQVKNLKKDMAY